MLWRWLQLENKKGGWGVTCVWCASSGCKSWRVSRATKLFLRAIFLEVVQGPAVCVWMVNMWYRLGSGLAHSTWGSEHQDYFENLSMLTSDRLPACQDLRACMFPRVRHTAVTAPQFKNTMRNHGPLRGKPRLALVLQVKFQKHTIAECFTCHLMWNSYQFTLHHHSSMFLYRK